MDFSTWKKIDTFPEGKPGVEALYREFYTTADSVDFSKTFVVYIKGTDSKLDWLIHILPGWTEPIEILYAYELLNRIKQPIQALEPTRVVLTGFSWGGAIAAIIQDIMRVELPKIPTESIGFGSKMPSVGTLDCLVRAPGDIVPFLTPWRGRRYKVESLLPLSWKPFWKAHKWSTYSPWFAKYIQGETV